MADLKINKAYSRPADLNQLPAGPAIVVMPGVWWEFDAPDVSARRLSCMGVASAMVNINRWGGNTLGRVIDLAAHSLHVAEVVARNGGTYQEIRTAVGHDAHEIVVGDVSRPLKIAMRWGEQASPYDAIEAEAKAAFATRFGLIYPHPEIVQAADNAVLGWEANDLYGIDPAAWGLPTGERGPGSLTNIRRLLHDSVDPHRESVMAVAALLDESEPSSPDDSSR